ncbi:MAG: hypothetical protein GY715_09315 [Planctomycetes bacterium]|nr:hypothetical protein [Planctomycetota bacterium]
MTFRRGTGFLGGMTVGGLLVVAGIALGGAGGKPPADTADVLRARSLEIVDEVGTVRLVVGTNERGGTMSVRDRLGRTVLLLGAVEHGGMLVATNTKGRQAALMAGATAAGGAVQLFDPAGRRGVDLMVGGLGGELGLRSVGAPGPGTDVEKQKPALHLRVDENRTGSVTGHDGRGAPRFNLGADAGGGGVIETYRGSGGRALVALSSTVGGHGQVKTTAPNGQTMVIMTATARDEGQVYTYDANGTPLVALASRASGPSLRVFNALGTPAVTIESDTEGNGTVSVWKPDGAGRSLEP